MENINVNETNVKEAEEKFKRDITSELGTYGVSVSNGVPQTEDFDKALVGDRAQKVYREMVDNDSTITSLLTTIQMLFRRIEWIVDLPYETKGIDEAEEQREFIEQALFFDMENTFDSFMSNVMSMLPFGYSLFEVVYKKRTFENSLFNDGKYGIKKLSFIPQRTRLRWDIADNGDILAFEQLGPDDGITYTIPYEKLLHFKSQDAEGNPEGKSILRGAYRAWYYLKRTQDFESIGVERELNGIPVVYVPNALLIAANKGDAAAKQNLEAYKKIARDMKANSGAGIVLPSDPFQDMDGKYSGTKKTSVELLSNRGTRAMDTDKIITRYQNDIARSVIASFIMLGGSERGSFALAESQQSIFLAAIEAWTEVIASEINRKLIPHLIFLNNMNPEYMPYLRPGELQPRTFDDLTTSIQKLAQAGMPLFPDPVLENFIREKGGLPILDPNYRGQIPQGYADRDYGTNYADEAFPQEPKEDEKEKVVDNEE